MDRILVENYEEYVRCIHHKYDPGAGQQPHWAAAQFRASGKTAEELAHDAIATVMESLTDEQFVAVPYLERGKFILGCLYRKANQLYYDECRRLRNRTRAMDGYKRVQDLKPKTKNDHLEYEWEESLSSLTTVERAIIRNNDETVTRMYQAFRPDVGYTTFNQRLAKKKLQLAQKLEVWP